MNETLYLRTNALCQWASKDTGEPQSLKILLEKLIKNPEHHYRFLNTLSLMELCGAQKLSRLGAHVNYSAFWLEHVAEEYRHAFYLRHLAGKVAKKNIDSYHKNNVLCLPKRFNYISSIDRNISLLLSKFNLLGTDNYTYNYLLTTLVIELRALPFYETYQSALQEAEAPISVKSIISEEEDHLSAIINLMQDMNMPKDAVNEAMLIEHRAYCRFITALEHAIKLASTVP